jgi:hypothetical protein
MIFDEISWKKRSIPSFIVPRRLITNLIFKPGFNRLLLGCFKSCKSEIYSRCKIVGFLYSKFYISCL